MIGLGIAIEVALHISRTQNGFYVPEKNVFSFASTQFLTSFFPTLLVVPLAFFWSIADWMLRWYQPYITLAEGSAPASRSILLDYPNSRAFLLVQIQTLSRLHLDSYSTHRYSAATPCRFALGGPTGAPLRGVYGN